MFDFLNRHISLQAMVIIDHVRKCPKASTIQLSRISPPDMRILENWAAVIAKAEMEVARGGGIGVEQTESPPKKIKPSTQQLVPKPSRRVITRQKSEASLYIPLEYFLVDVWKV